MPTPNIPSSIKLGGKKLDISAYIPKLLLSSEPITWKDLRDLGLQYLSAPSSRPDPIAPVVDPPVPAAAELTGLKCHLETYFHDWNRAPGSDDDMADEAQTAAVVDGNANLPPGSILWLIAEPEPAQRLPIIWHLQYDGEEEFIISDIEKVTPTDDFRVNGWKRYSEENTYHILVRLIPFSGSKPKNLSIWVSRGSIESEKITLSCARKKN